VLRAAGLRRIVGARAVDTIQKKEAAGMDPRAELLLRLLTWQSLSLSSRTSRWCCRMMFNYGFPMADQSSGRAQRGFAPRVHVGRRKSIGRDHTGFFPPASLLFLAGDAGSPRPSAQCTDGVGRRGGFVDPSSEEHPRDQAATAPLARSEYGRPLNIDLIQATCQSLLVSIARRAGYGALRICSSLPVRRPIQARLLGGASSRTLTARTGL